MDNNDKISIYEPGYRRRIGWIKSWSLMINNVFTSKDLIIQLFRRDFLMVYQKTFLGLGWLVLSPIVGIVSWVFMNYAGVLKPGDVGIPYPAYVLVGTSVWTLFLGFYNAAAQTLGAGTSFIMQVRYSHEVLLIKQTAQHIAGFCIAFLVNIIVLVSLSIIPSWKIIFFPVLILPLFFLGAGIGLVVSLASVIVPDLQKGFDLMLGLVFYVTPIIFSLDSIEPSLQKIVVLNPLTYLIGAARDCILFGKIDISQGYIFSLLFSLGAFLIAWRIFFLSEEKIIEKMI